MTRQPGGFGEVALPYAEVNIEKETFLEHPNPCPTTESIYNLCNVGWVVNRFKDDFVFNLMPMPRIPGTRSDVSRDALSFF